MAMPVPESVADAEMAGIPEVFRTRRGTPPKAASPLALGSVHAGASGVGTAAIQIAKSIGAKIAVTCSAGKADACRDLGADLVLERSPADWLAAPKPQCPKG